MTTLWPSVMGRRRARFASNGDWCGAACRKPWLRSAIGDAMGFDSYETGGFYDEWMAAPGIPRPEARLLVRMMESLPAGELQRRQEAAERAFRLMGITFAVYGHRDGAEKVWPFDLLPRLVAQDEWVRLERGLKQRIQALNMFLQDIYHEQRIVRDCVVPEEVIRTAKSF